MKKCFTLAEVLVVLAVIGVVSALLIPNIITKYQEKQTVAAVRKFYSEISEAHSRAIAKNGPLSNWGWVQSGAGSERIMDIYEPYLMLQKRCGAAGLIDKCFSSNKYKTLNPNIDWAINPATRYDYSSAKFTNGSVIWIWASSRCSERCGTSEELYNVCGYVGIDINGYKSPNRLGLDTFYFMITANRIIPMGIKNDTCNTLANRCNLSSDNDRNGYACTAWIITKGNMDYLKKSVSW